MMYIDSFRFPGVDRKREWFAAPKTHSNYALALGSYLWNACGIRTLPGKWTYESVSD